MICSLCEFNPDDPDEGDGTVADCLVPECPLKALSAAPTESGPTPLVDAEIQKGWPYPSHQGVVSADFARTLEEAVNHLRNEELPLLERRCQALEQALRIIAEPLVHLRAKALMTDSELDGNMAVRLANNAGYLREVARAALTGKPK